MSTGRSLSTATPMSSPGANRHPAEGDKPYFDLTSAMRVVDDRNRAPAVVSTGEEQITLVIDGERFIFHLVEAAPDRERLPPA